jgi:hypothetical protein
MGRIGSLLEADGFNVSLASSSRSLEKDPMVVTWNITQDDGAEFHTELHNLQLHILEMVMEFEPASYLVEVAKGLRDAMSGEPALNEIRRRWASATAGGRGRRPEGAAHRTRRPEAGA